MVNKAEILQELIDQVDVNTIRNNEIVNFALSEKKPEKEIEATKHTMEVEARYKAHLVESLAKENETSNA